MVQILIDTSTSSIATAYGGQRKLVKTSDGTLYTVYHKQVSAKYQIYIAKSIDNGATWVDKMVISTLGDMADYDQLRPSIAVDSDDHLHVVWDGRAVGYTGTQIWYAKYTDSWSTPTHISTYENMEGDFQYYPSISVDSSNYLHVVWEGGAFGYVEHQIWYAKYTDTWSNPLWISTYSGMSTGFQHNPSIVVDGYDNLHVVWYGTVTGYTTTDQIWYIKNNGPWQTPVHISGNIIFANYSQYFPSIAVDSNENLYVVWEGKAVGFSTAAQIWCNEYTGGWSGPTRLSTYAGMQSYPQGSVSIAVDSSDYVHVLWQGCATGYTDHWKIWYSWHIWTWGSPIVVQDIGNNISPNLRWSRYPPSNQVTATTWDRLNYVFTEGIMSPYDVMFNYPTYGPGLYDGNGNLLLLGAFLTRVLETRIGKYSAHQFPPINKEYLQSLGLKNRLFLLEALGTGSASNPMDRSVARTSALSLTGQDGYIITNLIPDFFPVRFLEVEVRDSGERPAELKIVVHAVERIMGSA